MPEEDRQERNWYWAAALMKSVHPGKQRRRHLWERTVFLLQATSLDHARSEAESIAIGKEQEYRSARGDRVQWVFQRIEDVQELFDSRPEAGTEVYWTFFERVDPKGSDDTH